MQTSGGGQFERGADMATRFLLDERNAPAAVRMLTEVAGVFARQGIRYALTAGTLLGVVREGRLLPWDSDMDLSIFAQDAPRFGAAIRELEASGYIVRLRMHSRTDHPLVKGTVRILKIWNRRWGMFRGRMLLDCFVKIRYEDAYYWAVGGEKEYAKKAVPARFYDRLESIEFSGKRFLVPSDPRGYLALRYGPDWQTPRKQWNYAKDDGAIIPAGGKSVAP